MSAGGSRHVLLVLAVSTVLALGRASEICMLTPMVTLQPGANVTAKYVASSPCRKPLLTSRARLSDAYGTQCQAILSFENATFSPHMYDFGGIPCLGDTLVTFAVPLGIPNGPATVIWFVDDWRSQACDWRPTGTAPTSGDASRSKFPKVSMNLSTGHRGRKAQLYVWFQSQHERKSWLRPDLQPPRPKRWSRWTWPYHRCHHSQISMRQIQYHLLLASLSYRLARPTHHAISQLRTPVWAARLTCRQARTA